MVPTTCLDNVTPPPLPPRTRPLNPLAKPTGPYYGPKSPMHQSMPAPMRDERPLRRSSHSLDGELDGPQPNSIAMQMSYPLVNAPPPPLQVSRVGRSACLGLGSEVGRWCLVNFVMFMDGMNLNHSEIWAAKSKSRYVSDAQVSYVLHQMYNRPNWFMTHFDNILFENVRQNTKIRSPILWSNKYFITRINKLNLGMNSVYS